MKINSQANQSFELNSVKAQESLNYDGISELNVTVTAAKELHKDNGLDELYFRVGGKDYVAFGQGMNTDALNSPIPATFNDQRVEIVDFSDEANTAWEGTKDIFSSIGGRLATGLGIAGGGMIGTRIANNLDVIGRGLNVGLNGSSTLVNHGRFATTYTNLWAKPTISEFGKFKIAAKSALIVGGVAALGTAVVGAVQGANASANYQSIHMATTGKTINPSAK